MNSYLEKVTESKVAHREALKSAPLLEKLAILDRLAERSWLIRGATGDPDIKLVEKVLEKRLIKTVKTLGNQNWSREAVHED